MKKFLLLLALSTLSSLFGMEKKRRKMEELRDKDGFLIAYIDSKLFKNSDWFSRSKNDGSQPDNKPNNISQVSQSN